MTQTCWNQQKIVHFRGTCKKDLANKSTNWTFMLYFVFKIQKSITKFYKSIQNQNAVRAKKNKFSHRSRKILICLIKWSIWEFIFNRYLNWDPIVKLKTLRQMSIFIFVNFGCFKEQSEWKNFHFFNLIFGVTKIL